MYALGVDIGGTAIKLGLFNDQGELLNKWQIKTRIENKGAYILDDVSGEINKTLKNKQIKKEDVVGIGIGIPGPVTQDGTVLTCPNLGWGIVTPSEDVSKSTGIRNVKVANDANVAALGEMWQGGGKGYQSIIMVTLGTGVGGGVILNGKILTGSKGAAGEIGHITVDREEEEACGCGNHGCLEQYASATGIVRLARRALARSDAPSVIRNEDINAKVVFDAAKAGDGLANEIVELFGKYLGITLSNIATTVDPEAFVIGGGVSKAGTIIVDVVRKYYNQYSMYAIRDKDIKLALLGNDAGIYGSVKMIL